MTPHIALRSSTTSRSAAPRATITTRTPPEPAFWFHITLHRTLPHAERRLWYDRLHHTLAKLDLAVSTQHAVSVVLGIRHVTHAADRQHITSWLMDQPEVWAVQVGELMPCPAQRSRRASAWSRSPVLSQWVVTGLPITASPNSFTRRTLRHIAQGAALAQQAKQWQLHGLGRPLSPPLGEAASMPTRPGSVV
ncbi:hypothetical protein [Caldimonas brevitalea]|uniref:Uncharacterized protein n=1 Tax=Caldimonas brevitalea TaxID=413882 RepID=A0A0G3BRD1_9BURK|nr:hypothetical protein [Caldimonas brevitalea]AKJ31984.1 hypothetical protein AAW51_5293 [Caldimonas brevitalea]